MQKTSILVLFMLFMLFMLLSSAKVTAAEFFLKVSDIERASLRQPTVMLKLNSEASSEFADFSERNKGQMCSIYLEGELISRYVIYDKIDTGTMGIKEPNEAVLELLSDVPGPNDDI